MIPVGVAAESATVQEVEVGTVTVEGEHVRLADISVGGGVIVTVAPLAITVTGLPLPSLADAPPMVTFEAGPYFVLAKARAAVARAPSETTFWFKPYTIQID